MPKFELEEIEIPGAVHKFYKLKRDGKCFYDAFIEEIKEKFGIVDEDDESHEVVGELDELYALIEDISLNNPVPPRKHKALKGASKKFPFSDYEIRTGSSRLRLYYIKEKRTGKVIILGEYKKDAKSQKRTIKRMRKIAKEYFKSLQD